MAELTPEALASLPQSTGIVLPPLRPKASNPWARQYIGNYWTKFLGASLADFDREQVVLPYGQALNDGVGMFISGPTGVGKTHLLAALFLDLADRGFDCAIYTYGDLLDDIRADFKREHDGKPTIVAYYLEKPVLMIDDIGSGRTTRWAAERTYRLLDERMRTGRPTYYTSNYRLEELGAALNECYDGESAVSTRDGDRIISRIAGSCVSVKLTGVDRRLQ